MHNDLAVLLDLAVRYAGREVSLPLYEMMLSAD